MSTTSPHRRTGAALTATTLAAWSLLALAPPATAEPPLRTGTGTGIVTSLVETSSREAGAVRIAERRLEGTITGSLQGTFSEEVRGVVHADGRVTFQGTLVFTGTVEGCGTGTLTARLTGRGQAGPRPVTVAHLVVIGGPGGTLDVVGHGTVEQDGPLLDYSIRYACR